VILSLAAVGAAVGAGLVESIREGVKSFLRGVVVRLRRDPDKEKATGPTYETHVKDSVGVQVGPRTTMIFEAPGLPRHSHRSQPARDGQVERVPDQTPGPRER